VQLTPRNARKRGMFLRAQGRTAAPMRGRLPTQPPTRWSGRHEPPLQQVGRANWAYSPRTSADARSIRAARTPAPGSATTPPPGTATADEPDQARRRRGAGTHGPIARSDRRPLNPFAPIVEKRATASAYAPTSKPAKPHAAARRSAPGTSEPPRQRRPTMWAPDAVAKDLISKAHAETAGGSPVTT
jgi:hypothetical protein